MWLLAVHGEHSAWVRNLGSDPLVRVRHRGRWHQAHATVQLLDDQVVRRFNRYARTGPKVFGLDPRLVRLEYDK